MSDKIRVWDPLVRIFHWSLVLAFAIAYFTGDEENSLHIYSGYVVAGLIGFRLVWGLNGSRYARFGDFVRSPTVVVGYLKGLMARKSQRYVGHNPAGGWMVVVMLLTLLVISVSGFKIYAIEEGLGPLAFEAPASTVVSMAYADTSEHEDDAEELWEEIHEISSNFMLLLIFLHIAGVLVSGRLHKENLVIAMISGKKNDRAQH